MYFQFLIEDSSTEILIGHVMNKLKSMSVDKEILYDTKSFKGIGHLRTNGNLMERKGGNLLNNLQIYLKGFDRSLSKMEKAAIIVVLDNDYNEYATFKEQLEQVAEKTNMQVDYAFCIAVKEMEAWLLGDEEAICQAYPKAKKKYLKDYVQDAICDTWEVLANMVYPGGLVALQKKSKNGYSETGKAKCEWADRIGEKLILKNNNSPSFNNFIHELQIRI